MSDSGVADRIELLSVDLLVQHAERAAYFGRLSRRLGISPGWHYPLDWIWLDRQLGEVRRQEILDAGAGVGLMQWHLALGGASVISVDRSSRAWLPLHLRHWYRASGLRPTDLLPFRRVLDAREPTISARQRGAALLRSALGGVLHLGRARAEGRVRLYTHDLHALPEIASGSIDRVVAVSSLEHNPPDRMEAVVNELWRVLKPGGSILATMAAARDEDWYHAPSSGWCYTESTLRRLFRVPESAPSNFADFDGRMDALRGCATLRKALARRYFRSGDNGMPWGVWNPLYQPVGIVVTKPAVRGGGLA